MDARPPASPAATAPAIPPQSLAALFVRFLRFGCLAFGGPVAQIAMLKKELVEDARWVSVEEFHRALAVYQVLPGPEAHELCVWFGMRARGRLGAVLAGLGFMLPGFVLICLLAAAYTAGGLGVAGLAAAFAGMQAAVVALVVRAVWRIGRHVVNGAMPAALAGAACAGSVVGLHFAVVLAAAALAGLACRRGRATLAIVPIAAAVVAGLVLPGSPAAITGALGGPAEPSGPGVLLAAGLRAGLLTFGGAYTAIPLLRHDAVGAGWLTDAQFLDGIALSGVLPAPLIIFGTFVGWVAGGWVGALAVTVGIFGPAFGFTLLGHDVFERLVRRPLVRDLLDGVMIGVVGLIAATALDLARGACATVPTAGIAVGALTLLLVWRSGFAVPAAIAAGAAAGAYLGG